MSNELAKRKTMLPDLKSLYGEEGLTEREKENDLNIILNQPPKPEWVKIHPYVKDHKYIPIEKVEYLLTRLFTKWRVEVKEVKLLANAVVVSVRLHYQEIVSGEWSWQDGIGAHNLQVNKDANPTDLSALKAGAVVMSAPIAETEAIKDAAHKLGKIFGKDLNRKDGQDYSALAGAFDTPEKQNQSLIIRFVALLEKYDGKDREAIRNEAKKLQAEGKFTQAVADKMASDNLLIQDGWHV